jgi:hypothetical protein
VGAEIALFRPLAGWRSCDRDDPPADDAISQAAHQESPPTAHKVVRKVLADIARTNGSTQRKKSALTVDPCCARRVAHDRRGNAQGQARPCVAAAGLCRPVTPVTATATKAQGARSPKIAGRDRTHSACVPGDDSTCVSLLARFDRRCARARNRSPQAGRERSDSRSRQRSRRNDEPSPICSLTSFEYCARCCCRCQEGEVDRAIADLFHGRAAQIVCVVWGARPG